MTRTLKAIYENGVLRPMEPLEGLQEHSTVTVTVQIEEHRHPLSDCIGILAEEDATEMREIIDSEFERVNPGDWE